MTAMAKKPSIRPDGAPKLDEKYRDWRDFTDRVARPWVENDGDDPKVDAWYTALMIAADPYYLAVSLVIADNTIRRLESEATSAIGPHD